jgi:predicted DNA-binding transcriptional regulator YafY
MSIKKYFTLLQTLDYYIRRKATGSPNQFAKRIGVSRRSILRMLKDLKELNIPIKFSKNRSSYYYTEEGNIKKELFERTKPLTREELKEIKGGNFSLAEYCKENRVTQYDTLYKEICLGLTG